jgi:tetratricopeptide (TPR) repeat protein
VAVIVSIVLVIATGSKTAPKSREKLAATVQKKGKSAVIRDYEKRIAHDPHNVVALEGLGEVYYSDSNWEKVWSIYRTLYDLSTAHIEINVAKTTSRLGVAAYNLGKIDEAINYLMVSTRKDSEVFDTTFYLGKSFEAKGNLEKAIICYKKSSITY